MSSEVKLGFMAWPGSRGHEGYDHRFVSERQAWHTVDERSHCSPQGTDRLVLWKHIQDCWQSNKLHSLHYFHCAATQQQLQLIQDMRDNMGLQLLNEDSFILFISDVASVVITDTTDTSTHNTTWWTWMEQQRRLLDKMKHYRRWTPTNIQWAYLNFDFSLSPN